MKSYICRYVDPDAANIDYVGGKFANLSHLETHGFPVPPAFCVTTAAYKYVIHVTGLTNIIERITSELNPACATDMSAAAAEIRELIEQQPIPEAVAREIREAYLSLGRSLGCQHIESTPVAVRSSATVEDLPGASFAGQQDTFLNIHGSFALLEHVRHCWASLWTARALTYRERRQINHQRAAIAVIVQVLVNPSVSGVMFTANPINSRPDQCVINASWGLGEAIVSGSVTPDTYIVDKRTGRIVEQTIASKTHEIVISEGLGARQTMVPHTKQKSRTLTEQCAAHLAALGTRIEQSYGTPQDIEWAQEAGHWYVLQSRPITTLENRYVEQVPTGRYSRAMFADIFSEALSPAFLSVVCPLLDGMFRHALRTLGFQKQPKGAAVKPIFGQPYLDVGFIEQSLREASPRSYDDLVTRFTDIFTAESPTAGGRDWTQLAMAHSLWRFVHRFRRTLPELLSRYHADVEALNDLPVNKLSDSALVQKIRRISFEGAGRLLNNDFLLIASAGFYRTLLQRLLLSYTADPDTVLDKLLSAVSGNVVVRTNKLLWDLAQTARAYPHVTRVLLDETPSAAYEHLSADTAALEFMSQFEQALAYCGHREQRLDICYPTWGEDPAAIFVFLRSYLSMEAQVDPYAKERNLARQRQAATARVREAFSRSPGGRLFKRPLFDYVLRQAQWLARERDTMHFEWTRTFPGIRRIELELGERWEQRELIAKREDIFFLTLDEQEQLAEKPDPQHDLIEARREAFQRNLHGPWPLQIIDGQGIIEAASSRPEPFEEEKGLQGIPGSPGTAHGSARIIRGPEEFHRLRHGEILVAPSTNPAWTPLFAVAAGIITECGGALSHGAIVAREYGIPAVMAVPNATSLLDAGEEISVDGTRGIIQRTAQSATTTLAHNLAERHRQTARQRTERLIP